MERYLLRLKGLNDQLIAAGETISNNDLIVATLAGLPYEYNMIKTIIVARESSIFLKEFQAQLLSAERTAEESQSITQFSMAGMYTTEESSNLDQHFDSGLQGGFGGKQFYYEESSNAGSQ